MTDTKMKIDDFHLNQLVIYIPNHACGNQFHEDCEFGIVSSKNENTVFVKYIKYGVLQVTAQGTDPSNLKKVLKICLPPTD